MPSWCSSPYVDVKGAGPEFLPEDLHLCHTLYRVPGIWPEQGFLSGSCWRSRRCVRSLWAICRCPVQQEAAENVFLRGFVLAYGQGLVAPAMLLSRTINCYLVVAVTGLIFWLAGCTGKDGTTKAVRSLMRHNARQFTGVDRLFFFTLLGVRRKQIPVTFARPCAYNDPYGLESVGAHKMRKKGENHHDRA